MFDRDFFRFALGLAAIIALALGALYISNRFENQNPESQTAAIR